MRFFRLTNSRYIDQQKESPQDNGGAAYLLTDTFGLCRAGRRVRHDVLSAERQTQRRNGDWRSPGEDA